jgi:hypothetical protein
MQLLISGGYPRKDHHKRKEGFRYDTAYLVRMNWETGGIVESLNYKSPAEHRHPNATMQFKIGSLVAGELIVPSSTEILFIDATTFSINKVISLPVFNDLHHVSVKNGLCYIANTGMEAVQVMDRDGKIVKEWPMAKDPTWKNFDKNSDYRFVGSTKPHEVHLNYVFFIEGEPWCTRFQQRDAVSLKNPDRRIDLNVSAGKPHDGLVAGDYIYFTITDGYLVVVNRHTLKKVDVVNFNEISGKNLQLGWCRGLDVIGNQAFVGFSMLRRSKFLEYGSWIVLNKKRLPARIAQYDLASRKLVQERIIGKRGAAIFTIKNIN